ncbi:MAG: His/Gly/Thr/Pro-type tRNA ligase C-terminal domain-containing protein [Balneolaceae bacterium]|nr:His/Gly/Thr/Pro-type tRNA ligase C-terminal domain-containing protein [Balneolaceae bacterium]
MVSSANSKEKEIRVKLDDRENYNPGWKFAEHEAAGIPLRIAVGPRDLENHNVELARRDTLEKNIVDREGLGDRIDDLLQQIQKDLYDSAHQRIENNTHTVDSYDEFQRGHRRKRGLRICTLGWNR